MCRRAVANKDIQRIVRDLQRDGWEVAQGKKHYKAVCPGTGKVVVFSVTPSCHHAVKNIEGDIKRAMEVNRYATL